MWQLREDSSPKQFQFEFLTAPIFRSDYATWWGVKLAHPKK